MNKISVTLAGLAVVAGASMAPASAQTFTNAGAFTFAYSPTTFTVSSIAGYLFTPTATYTGTLSLYGGTSLDGIKYTDTTLKFVSGGFTDIESGFTTFVNPLGSTDLISGATPLAKVILYPSTPAVPEASTVVSFGALLALGGLAFLRRKTARTAA